MVSVLVVLLLLLQRKCKKVSYADDWPPWPRQVYNNTVVHIVNYIVYKIILASNLCFAQQWEAEEHWVLVRGAVEEVQQALSVQVMVQRLLLLVFAFVISANACFDSELVCR